MRNKNQEVIGVLSSFEDLTDVKLMAEELIGYSSLIDELRAQNHEFNNRLHTISGLIQLEEYSAVLDYITELRENKIQISNLIRDKIKNNYIAAILLGKYNKAEEAKVKLMINDESYLFENLLNVEHDDLCSIIGNLLDNSIEELIGKDKGVIELFILSDEQGVEIVVEDNGSGIDEEVFDHMYERGITTKQGSRGTGLFIVKEIVDIYGGDIEVTQDNGTQWKVKIPFEIN